MICEIQIHGLTHSACCLCYDNPVNDEAQQHIPLLRWMHLIHFTTTKSILERMTLILLSTTSPKVFHGLCVAVEGKITFHSSCGLRGELEFIDTLNESINTYIQYDGLPLFGPCFVNGRVVIERLKCATFDNEVDGVTFVKEWISTLILASYQFTSFFLQALRKGSMPLFLTGVEQASTDKNTSKIPEGAFWIWLPITKPRNLQNWIDNYWIKSAVDLDVMMKYSPCNAGVYFVSIYEKDDSLFMKWADTEKSQMICYLDEPSDVPSEYQLISSHSDERRIIYNYSFALAALEDLQSKNSNVYGIYGETAYITAYLLPFERTEEPPLLPCRSSKRTIGDLFHWMRNRNGHNLEVTKINLRNESGEEDGNKAEQQITSEDDDNRESLDLSGIRKRAERHMNIIRSIGKDV